MEKTVFQPSPNDFLTLEEVQQGIQVLESTDWMQYLKEYRTVGQVFQATSDKLALHFKTKFMWLIYPHDLNETNLPFGFFRVRPADLIQNPNITSEYSYPAAEITRHNRANYPHHPVLYCSENINTALAETIKSTHSENMNREYCVASWKLKESGEVNMFFYLYDRVHESSLFKKMGEAVLKNKLNEIFQDMIKDQNKIDGIQEMLKYYSRSFIDDEYPYPISSFLGHNTLYSGFVDFLLYPSIQTDMRTINIAVAPKYVHSNMYLKYVLKLKVRPFENFISLPITISHYAIVDDQGVNWKRVDHSDQYKEVCADFGIKERNSS